MEKPNPCNFFEMVFNIGGKEYKTVSDEKGDVKYILHAKNVGPEERAKFTRRMTVEELISALTDGAPGKKLLVSKPGNPDDNIVFEYKKELQ